MERGADGRMKGHTAAAPVRAAIKAITEITAAAESLPPPVTDTWPPPASGASA